MAVGDDAPHIEALFGRKANVFNLPVSLCEFNF
jgi:hypothetical protein